MLKKHSVLVCRLDVKRNLSPRIKVEARLTLLIRPLILFFNASQAILWYSLEFLSVICCCIKRSLPGGMYAPPPRVSMSPFIAVSRSIAGRGASGARSCICRSRSLRRSMLTSNNAARLGGESLLRDDLSLECSRRVLRGSGLRSWRLVRSGEGEGEGECALRLLGRPGEGEREGLLEGLLEGEREEVRRRCEGEGEREGDLLIDLELDLKPR